MKHRSRLVVLEVIVTTVLLAAIAAAQTASKPDSKEEAIEAARAEVSRYPDSAESHYRLGEAYIAHSYRAADNAIGAFEKAIELKPDFAEAYYGLAVAIDMSHRYLMPGIRPSGYRFQERCPKEEAEALRKAIELKPDYAEAYVRLARTYMVNPSYPNLDLEKTYKPAVALLDKAVELNPDLIEAYEELGRVFKVLRQEQESKETYQKAEELKRRKDNNR